MFYQNKSLSQILDQWMCKVDMMLTNGHNLSRTTGCPKKNARLSLEANISGLKKPIRKSKTSLENYMFLA